MIDTSVWWYGAWQEICGAVIGSMGRQTASLGFTKHLKKVIISFRNWESDRGVQALHWGGGNNKKSEGRESQDSWVLGTDRDQERNGFMMQSTELEYEGLGA